MDKHFILKGKHDIFTFPGNDTVYIGETNGCDLKIPNNTEYEDEIIAKIVPTKGGDGWHIVRLTPYISIFINGSYIGRVAYLDDGDRIDIGDNSFRFHVREGSQSTITVNHLHHNKKAIWSVVAALIVIICMGVLLNLHLSKEKINGQMQREIYSSLYKLRVDSIHLMHGDTIKDSFMYIQAPVGTAFLTTDSLWVTARHCIQPWLNTDSVNYDDNSYTNWPKRNAMFVETEYQMNGDDTWELISFITLTNIDSNREITLRSDDFHINRELDDIIESGDFDNPTFWRSIAHGSNRNGMMLGDIAVAKADTAGYIPLASRDELTRLEQEKKLYFYGFPMTDTEGSKPAKREDELVSKILPLAEDSTHLFLLSHYGNLSKGFSGGPVITRDGMKYKAVGVISVIDAENKYQSYSVPTSETEFIKPVTKPRSKE